LAKKMGLKISLLKGL